MSAPEHDLGITEAADHNVPDGATLGWAAVDMPADLLVGDDETDALPLVADGTQTDGAGDAVQ